MNSALTTMGERMWEAVDPQAREDWAVGQAALAPVTQAVVGLLLEYDLGPALEATMKEALEQRIFCHYGVPPERNREVLARAAVELIRQETDSHGEA